MTGRVLIGEGKHGLVELDPATGVVAKHLRMADPAEAAGFACREYDRLQRFSAALSPYPFVRCPEPVDVDPARGIIRMSLCPGRSLERLLTEVPREIALDLDHIAEQIANAVEAYIEEFEEPCYSLSTHNMLYDPGARRLSLVDFTKPRTFVGVEATRHPFEVTLGCFVGTTTYHTVRARGLMWAKAEYRDIQQRLCIALLERVAVRKSLDIRVIRDVAGQVYEALGLAMSKGRPLRRAWYSSAGRLLFERRCDRILHRRDAVRAMVRDHA